MAEAVRRISRGELDKVVLARDLIAQAENDIDLRWVAGRLAERYPQCWTYLVDGLVGATPEMLVKREAGLARSRVLAGTIRRSGHDDHDLNLAAALSRSSKDLEEHEYAVRSVAAALSPYCSDMEIPETPYVLVLPNLLHLATDVSGGVRSDVSSLALAAALHPIRRRLRHAHRPGPSHDRRPGAPGPRGLHRSGGLGRRPRATVSGGSPCGAV